MDRIYGRYFAAIYDEKFANWMARVWPFILKAARKENPGALTWLDLCCGTGTLMKFVLEHGFLVAGVDRSRYQLQFARKNAPAARIQCGDIRKFSFPWIFDVVTCIYDSLNYLTSMRDLESVFHRVRRHLNRNGLFAFDMNTFEGLRDRWCQTTTMRGRTITLLLETSFNARRALGKCRVTGFVKEGRRYRKFEEIHVERGYRASEIERLLGRTGFTFHKFDGETLLKPKRRSGRLLYLCRGKDF